ncbi:MAG: RIP metalloprotease RseP [Bacteroidales bacterium]|nr:RIP metalloprotease RseP [Bacteroidales bacterium]
MEIFIKIVQLLLCLSILVILHEFGHFITAKIFGARVEKFYLFFNPWFSLCKFKIGETEYGIGWIPLGGYVKISGMIDESMDTEQMKQPPQPYEFRSKPAWQRLIIMLGGVIMNILTAIVIYICLIAHYGETYLPTQNVKYGITVDSLGYELGLRNGDKILSLDNEVVESFYKIPEELLLNDVKTIQVERDGKKIDLPVTDEMIGKLINAKGSFISPRIPFYVGAFGENSPAQNAGLQVNDKIIGIGDKETEFFDEFKDAIPAYKNQEVDISVVRDNDTLQYPVVIGEDGTIGVYVTAAGVFDFAEKSYTVWQAIPAGCAKAFTSIGSYLKQLKLLFNPQVKAYESVGSFITIGSIFPGTWDWQSFWTLTAFISIILAIMNIIPIPGLDGGHVLFVLVEMITGRKPSDKFLEYAQTVGMILILALFALAMWNDISRFIIK